MSQTCGCGCGKSPSPVDLRDPGRPLVLGPEDTVAAAVARAPDGLLVLQRLGIDACCGGHLTLAQAAASAGVPVQTLVDALQPLVSPPTT